MDTIDDGTAGIGQCRVERKDRPICAGDEISVTHRVADVYDKQAPNGRLLFVVLETRGTDTRGRQVCKGRRVLVELKN